MDKEFFTLDQIPTDPRDALAWVHSRYAQVFGWISDPDKLFLVKFLPEVASEFDYPIHIVEIGTFNGGSTRGLIALTGGYLTGIDDFSAFEGDGRRHLRGQWNSGQEQFWDTLRFHVDLSSHVKRLISDRSQNVGQTWNEPIELLLIDGSHEYEDVTSDIHLFCPYVIHQGYILIDDWNMDTVRTAADETLDNNTWERIRVPDLSTTAKLFCAKKR